MIETTAVVSADSLPGAPASDLDAEGQQLRDLAQKADTGEITQEETEAVETGTLNAEKKDATDQQRPADAETEKTEETKPDNPEPSADQKAESSYQKRKRELEAAEKRQAETWKKLDEGKLKWQTQLQNKIAQLEAQLQQPRQAQGPQQQQPRFSSQHLAQAADEFEAKAVKLLREGDTESAQAEIDLARKARQAAQESYFAEQREAYQGAYSQHEQAWRNTASQVIQAHPELADPSSEAAQHMQKLLQEKPIFGEMPDGFKEAYALLELRRDAAEASGLKEKVASLEKQLKELQERTSIKGSGPMSRTDRNLEDLSLEEQERALRQQVVEADRLAFA